MDQIIIDGDQVLYIPIFGQAIVIAPPGAMKASASTVFVKGKKVCLDGDEASAEVENCPYIMPPFVIPGMGIVRIAALAGDQLSKKTTADGKAEILKGLMFDAEFEVKTEAQMPTPSGPQKGPKLTLKGKGMFSTKNFLVTDGG